MTVRERGESIYNLTIVTATSQVMSLPKLQCKNIHCTTNLSKLYSCKMHQLTLGCIRRTPYDRGGAAQATALSDPLDCNYLQDHPITTISSSNPRYNHHHHHHHVFTNAEDVRLSGSLGGETQKF